MAVQSGLPDPLYEAPKVGLPHTSHRLSLSSFVPCSAQNAPACGLRPAHYSPLSKNRLTGWYILTPLTNIHFKSLVVLKSLSSFIGHPNIPPLITA